MAQFNLKVNGVEHQVDVDADTPILWVLRDNLKLVGTKYGCGIAQCGACTIHVNGTAIRSCSLPSQLPRWKRNYNDRRALRGWISSSSASMD